MMNRRLALVLVFSASLGGCLQSDKPLFGAGDFRDPPKLAQVWIDDNSTLKSESSVSVLNVRPNADGSYSISGAGADTAVQTLGFVPLAGDAYLAQWCKKKCFYLVARSAEDGWDFVNVEQSPASMALAAKHGIDRQFSAQELTSEIPPETVVAFFRDALAAGYLGKSFQHFRPGDQALARMLDDPDAALAVADAAYEKKDFAAARAIYLPLAQANNVRGQLRIGKMALLGDGVPLDEPLALAWVKRAANEGSSKAQYVLGRLYSDGIGAAQSYTEAAAAYLRAAKQGHALAQLRLGALYYAGNGVAKDLAQAAAWFRKAAASGVPEAQNCLGVMYADAQGLPRNDVQAVLWYRKAAEQGNADAQYNLGMMYAQGRALPRDPAQALGLIQTAAQNGSPDAQNNIGARYETGDGFAIDNAQAVTWYARAAEQGLDLAQYNLARHYESGIGIAQDVSQSAQWYTRSAQQGFATAQYNLGIAYLRGIGVPKDRDTAITWISAAAKQGDATAVEALQTLSVAKAVAEITPLQMLAIAGLAFSGMRSDSAPAPVFQWPETRYVPCYSKEELGCNWE